eukprot:6034076-Alexandrium_andersonii.AAC.1
MRHWLFDREGWTVAAGRWPLGRDDLHHRLANGRGSPRGCPGGRDAPGLGSLLGGLRRGNIKGMTARWVP